MDKATQQNTASTEESAAASQELDAQAEQMNSHVVELLSLAGAAVADSAGQLAKPASGERLHREAHLRAQHQLPQPSPLPVRAVGKTRTPAPAKRVTRKLQPEAVIPPGEEDFDQF